MMRKIHTVFHLTLYLLISFSFFGKSMRLARKEKKAERKRMIRLWSDRAGKAVGKRSWGGEREKEQEGLAPSLGLGEGWSAVRMSSGKTKGRPG